MKAASRRPPWTSRERAELAARDRNLQVVARVRNRALALGHRLCVHFFYLPAQGHTWREHAVCTDYHRGCAVHSHIFTVDGRRWAVLLRYLCPFATHSRPSVTSRLRARPASLLRYRRHRDLCEVGRVMSATQPSHYPHSACAGVDDEGLAALLALAEIGEKC